MKLCLRLVSLFLLSSALVILCDNHAELCAETIVNLQFDHAVHSALAALPPTPHKAFTTKGHFERVLTEFPLFVSNIFALVVHSKNPAAIASHALQIINSVITMMQDTLSKEEIMNEANKEPSESTRLPIHPADLEPAPNHALSQKQVKKEEIINTVLGMLGNFAHILADPHNPEIVRPHAAGMIHGLLNIIHIAKKSRLFEEDVQLNEAINSLMHDSDIQELMLSTSL